MTKIVNKDQPMTLFGEKTGTQKPVTTSNAEAKSTSK